MKYVYFFGSGHADGTSNDRNLLGGKGANLAEMTRLNIPVPPGFTITTDVCNYFMDNTSYPAHLEDECFSQMNKIEDVMEQSFGSSENPLLVSVRSGARQSMPGMMETVLNVGLTSKTIPGLIEKTNNPRFVYDAYRRLIMMYADVVMEKSEGIEPNDGHGIREQLELILDKKKHELGISLDTELSVDDLKEIANLFKQTIKSVLHKDFPDDANAQLWGAITAVFKSWNGKRAVNYRKIENIPNRWGTAVNIQAMVFGNMGEDSATGVAFTRNPATGENAFYGEWLINAQGEDVVAGTRTPNPLNNDSRNSESATLISLEDNFPEMYNELVGIRNQLEAHYRDMQDIEFTIQNKRLWMLQTRKGKRNGTASIRMAIEMKKEGLISKEEAIKRVKPSQLDEIMHPMIQSSAEQDATLFATGLPAGPGGGSGQIVFTANDAEQWKAKGKKVVLVRSETSPEDIHGMHASEAILTARGGMTSHAALVARGWGKCCVVGCASLEIDNEHKTLTVDDTVLKEGDWLTLNGSSGNVYLGALKLVDPVLEENPNYIELMQMADDIRKLNIRTNADSPNDAQIARNFGAEGIGLCRTEHMFFDPKRIRIMRQMIVSDNKNDRRNSVMKLLPFQREDFYGILKAMAPHPVTIRLLDPPLHEFLPQDEHKIEEIAQDLQIKSDDLAKRIEALHELNPMLGHRGCRLGIAYPEITEMQSRAICEATAQLISEGYKPFPEIMIPLIGTDKELTHQKKIVTSVAEHVMTETGTKFKYLVGTMIELPRACLTADEIAGVAEFFSFGTNDLTQTTFGFSRDDIGGFLPLYLSEKMLPGDPFQSIDQCGVGQLVKMGVDKGRCKNPTLKIGVCGEHGGDPNSIQFFHNAGLDYVSCSPYRVPIARLSAAQSVLNN
jgi:pyruvate,orthophosphate dikinase